METRSDGKSEMGKRIERSIAAVKTHAQCGAPQTHGILNEYANNREPFIESHKQRKLHSVRGNHSEILFRVG